MKSEHGLDLPRKLQIEFSRSIQAIAEDSGTEIEPQAMWDAFENQYLRDDFAIKLVNHEVNTSQGKTTVAATISVDGKEIEVNGIGGGPISAFLDALNAARSTKFEVTDYSEHAIAEGTDATAAAFVGKVCTIVGAGSINIDDMSLGRGEKSTSMMVIATSEHVTDVVLEELNGTDGVNFARSISLD